MCSATNNPETPHAPLTGNVAYLLSRYPAVSHTFFLREILGLRALGLSISVTSINPADRPYSDLSPEERTEAQATHYLKGKGLLTPLSSLLLILATHPTVAMRGFLAVLRLRRQPSGNSLLLLLAYLAEALLVGHWMHRSNLRHLHVHFGGPVATVGLLTSQAWDLPWSLTLHGPDEFLDEARFFLQAKFLAASAIFVISDYTRSQVLRIAPQSADKIQIRRLGVQFAALQALRASSSRKTPTPLQLVCTARLVPFKGHRILFQSFALLRASLSSGFPSPRLTLIGGGPELAVLQNLASQLGIADSIEWTGPLSHQHTLQRVAAADIFLLPSFHEGLPVSLMEAMALGVPCISTFTAGIPELIRDGQTGLLVPSGDPDALFLALQRLISTPSLCATIADAAIQTVRTQYDLAVNLQPLATDLCKLSSQSRRAERRR